MKRLNFPKGFTLLGTDNNGYRHRYNVRKNESFKGIFIKFMVDLGFEEKRIQAVFMGRDDEENPVPLKVMDFNDCCLNFENKNYDVDVFFGEKKIIIVIRIHGEKNKKRLGMLDDLEYKSKWVKTPSVKSLKKSGEKAKRLVFVSGRR